MRSGLSADGADRAINNNWSAAQPMGLKGLGGLGGGTRRGLGADERWGQGWEDRREEYIEIFSPQLHPFRPSGGVKCLDAPLKGFSWFQLVSI